MSQYGMPIRKLYLKRRVWQRFPDNTFNFDYIVFGQGKFPPTRLMA